MIIRISICVICFYIGYTVYLINVQENTPIENTEVPNQCPMTLFPVKVGMKVRVINPESHLFNKVGTVVSIGVEPDHHLIKIDGVGYIIPYRNLDSIPPHVPTSTY